MTIKNVWLNCRIATMSPSSQSDYGELRDHFIVTENGMIAELLPIQKINLFKNVKINDLQGKWITPGFIDCHTHLVYAGSRAEEWQRRLNGETYQQISSQGGGILSTVKQTRLASEEELIAQSIPRLKALAAEGVTCIEIKSGYGLDLDSEIKILKAAKKLQNKIPIEVVTTLLAAHAVPPEFKGESDLYIQYIIDHMIPYVAHHKLAEAVDVFCENIGFTYQQCQAVFTAAKKYNLKIKAHADQLSDQNAAELVTQFFGLSADHIEFTSIDNINKMQQSGTVAVLLPGAFYFLQEKQKPPVAELRKAGVKMAVASDLNPGTSPFASIRLAMNQACVLFGLTPQEALTGVTRSAAAALGRNDTHGQIAPGFIADFLVWDIDHPAELAYSVGVNQLIHRVFRGEIDTTARNL